MASTLNESIVNDLILSSIDAKVIESTRDELDKNLEHVRQGMRSKVTFGSDAENTELTKSVDISNINLSTASQAHIWNICIMKNIAN